MRFIDRTGAMAVAGFHSLTRANERLLKLLLDGFLYRFFVGTIPGGRKALYCLSPKGAAVIGAPFRGIQRLKSITVAYDQFADHQMHLNQIYLAVKHQPIPLPAVRFIRWASFQRPLLANLPLIPDGYFELDTKEGIRALFVEVDLGTESLKVFRQKVERYLKLALSGQFQELFSVSRFRVLVITASKRREKTIRAVVRRSTDKVFWFTTFEQIYREGFWSAVWLKPEGEQRLPLV